MKATVYVLGGLVAALCQRCGRDIFREPRADLDKISQAVIDHTTGCPTRPLPESAPRG